MRNVGARRFDSGQLHMSGKWTGSNRASRLPPDWKKRRAAVAARAGYYCEAIVGGERCRALGAECDHITPGDDHSLENLAWLCQAHHKAKTQTEAVAARKAKYSRKRPEEPHPGSLK